MQKVRAALKVWNKRIASILGLIVLIGIAIFYYQWNKPLAIPLLAKEAQPGYHQTAGAPSESVSVVAVRSKTTDAASASGAESQTLQDYAKIIESATDESQSQLQALELKRAKWEWETELPRNRMVVISLRRPEGDEIGEMANAFSKTLRNISEPLRSNAQRDLQNVYKKFVEFPRPYKVVFQYYPKSSKNYIHIIDVSADEVSEVEVSETGGVGGRDRMHSERIDMRNPEASRYWHLTKLKDVKNK